MDFLLVLTLLLEVAFLFYLEKRAWKTIYTPLNFLMLPYLAVLLITIAVSGSRFGFVDFYYPSILLWIVGLVLFAIPSYLIAYAVQKGGKPLNCNVDNPQMPKILVFASAFLCLIMLYHLKSTLGSSAEALGSDEFGEDFSGHGIWGQIRMLTMPLLVMSIYYVDRKRWWAWIFIVVFILVSLLNQVKGWTIIPSLAGICLRLYTGKTKLSYKLILWVILGAFLVFFASYAMSILLVQDRGVSNDFMQFIFGHFFHYLTSGTIGLSEDALRGYPDAGGSFQTVIAQVVNICKIMVGDHEMVYPVNPLYYFSGVDVALTNVRTFFGTVYINSTPLVFCAYVLFMSTMMYMMRLAMLKYNNIYMFTIYFFYGSLLFMGWFDLYFANLTILEFPVLVLIYMLAEKMLQGKMPEDYDCNNTLELERS